MEHIYAIGQSGSVKSTLLRNRMLSNIYDGLGVFYFDPHGADTDTLLPLIPRDRANNVILFDPSDAEHPIPLNPLELNGHIAVVTSAIERAIKDNIGYLTRIDLFILLATLMVFASLVQTVMMASLVVRLTDRQTSMVNAWSRIVYPLTFVAVLGISFG